MRAVYKKQSQTTVCYICLGHVYTHVYTWTALRFAEVIRTKLYTCYVVYLGVVEIIVVEIIVVEIIVVEIIMEINVGKSLSLKSLL